MARRKSFSILDFGFWILDCLVWGWEVLAINSVTKRQTRLRKRNCPSTSASSHSKSFSGGALNKMNIRAVSAPYLLITSSGATPLYLDLDIVL